MSKIITDVEVGKISLVTSVHNPAVPKASKMFAIMKLFQRNKVSTTTLRKIEDIQRGIKIDQIKV